MSKPSFDPFLLFAEERSVYLTERQLVFCRIVLNRNDSRRAYDEAGFPRGDAAADRLYDELATLLEEWRELQKTDYMLVINTLREAATSAMSYKYYQDMELHCVKDYGARRSAVVALSDVMGFNAPKVIENKVTASVAIPDSLQEKLDNVYKQAGCK